MKANKTIFGLIILLAISAMSCSKETIATDERPPVNGAFTVVSQPPSPIGGMKEFYTYIGENLKYPVAAKKDSIQGKIFIKYMVLESGKLSNFEILKGIGHGCDEAALEVLKNAPTWNAGEHNGRIVKVWMTLPIVFKL